jgi:hypothetical protein
MFMSATAVPKANAPIHWWRVKRRTFGLAIANNITAPNKNRHELDAAGPIT